MSANEFITVLLDEKEKHAVVMALAHLAISRPGWRRHLNEIAIKCEGEDLFNNYFEIEMEKRK